jgi:chemotaxis protein methyltransferase CheR
MNNALPDGLLSELSEWVAARTALHFPRERWWDLIRKVSSAAKEFGFTDVEACIQWLVSSPVTREQIEILASHLTIAETYFWREPQVFAALGEQILPGLIRTRASGDRRLRIWSAACASGEEPYSIAIALCRALPARQDWRITLLATDINPRILHRAAAGVYGEWSFRNAPSWLKGDYFRRKYDGKWELLPEIRQMVTFAYLNLAEDVYPSPLNNTNAMDIIFCRNVLMYFASERARQVARRLHGSLLDGGWLMVGASELSQAVFSQFTSVHFPEAILYRKEAPHAPPSVVFRPEETSPPKALVQPPLEATVMPLAPPLPRRKRAIAPAAVSAQPPPTAYAQALDLYAQGRYTEVLQKLEGVATPDGGALAVRALANQGKLAEALALCEQAIAANKLDPGLHYLGATILQELNRDGEAIAALKRALYLDPKFVLAHFALANLVLRQGNVPAARKCYQNVLALLSDCRQEDILPESEGLTAGRFKVIAQATMQTGALGEST